MRWYIHSNCIATLNDNSNVIATIVVDMEFDHRDDEFNVVITIKDGNIFTTASLSITSDNDNIYAYIYLVCLLFRRSPSWSCDMPIFQDGATTLISHSLSPLHTSKFYSN